MQRNHVTCATFWLQKCEKKCNSLKQPPKIQGNVPSKRNHRLESTSRSEDGFGVVLRFRANALIGLRHYFQRPNKTKLKTFSNASKIFAQLFHKQTCLNFLERPKIQKHQNSTVSHCVFLSFTLNFCFSVFSFLLILILKGAMHKARKNSKYDLHL